MQRVSSILLLYILDLESVNKKIQIHVVMSNKNIVTVIVIQPFYTTPTAMYAFVPTYVLAIESIN